MEWAEIKSIVDDVAERFGVSLEVDEVIDAELVELLATEAAAQKVGVDLEEEEVDLSELSAQQNLRRGIEELRAKRLSAEGRAEARERRGRPAFEEV